MGFNSIFWGILFFFDFRLQGIDVLPDFIGYILIFIGCSSLSQRNGLFDRPKIFSLILVIISVFDIYQMQNNRGMSYVLEFHPIQFVFGLIFVAMNLLLVYQICTGIQTMSFKTQNYDLANKAISRWKLYLFLQLSVLILAAFSIFLPFLALLVIPLFVFSIVVLVLLMSLMKECEQFFYKSESY